MIKTAKSSPNAKNVVDEKETEAKADTKNVVDEETEAKADTYEKEYPKLEVEKLEQIRAKEYSEKSNDERESLLNELHGVSSRAVPENPEMIHAALLLFQLELDKCSLEHEKRAYLRACSMKSTYVHSVGFRLKFLRAEFFHVRNATLRYLQNLNYMLDKFGEIALMRQLYMSDLNNEDIRFLKKGYMQILPFRDRAGRRILASLGSLGGFEYSMETKERVAIYICHAILSEDVVSQRKGAVMLGLLNEEAIESIRMIKMSNTHKFMQAMPLRFSGLHSCLPDDFRFRVIKAMVLLMNKGDNRHLTRIHIGTQIECDYKLRSFGIPTEFIPRSYTGKIKDSYHKTFLKIRMAIDAHRRAEARNDYRFYYAATSRITPFPAIECPENNCFLVRKHGVAWNNPGNIELRVFLEEKERENGRKRLKGEFISGIVDEISARNINILVFDEQHCWYTKVTEKDEIQKHILQTLRDIRKRKKNKKNRQVSTNTSNTNEFRGLDGNIPQNGCLCDTTMDEG